MIPKYLTKFTQCQDELGSVGIIVAEEDMVSLSLSLGEATRLGMTMVRFDAG